MDTTAIAFGCATSAVNNAIVAADRQGDMDGNWAHAAVSEEIYRRCLHHFDTELGMPADNPAMQYLKAEREKALAELPEKHCIAHAAGLEKTLLVHAWDSLAVTARRMIEADQRQLATLRLENEELTESLRRLTASTPPEDTEIHDLPQQADNKDIRKALHRDMVRLRVEVRDLSHRLWLEARLRCGEPRTEAALARIEARTEVALGRTEASLRRSDEVVRCMETFVRMQLAYLGGNRSARQ